MFGTLGGPELFLIFVVALIVFGPRKLPEIGKSLGKMMAEFRKASNEFRSTIENEVEAEKIRESMRIETPPAAPAYPVETTAATASDAASASPAGALADGATTPPDAGTAAPGPDATPSDTLAADAGPGPAHADDTPATAPAPGAPREPVPETVSRQPEPTPIEPK
jgi:Tat protein translocase TatB subunit